MREFKRYKVTYSLLLICVVMYIYCLMRFGYDMNAYEALAAGAFNPVMVKVNHEYYRLITANFLHFGIIHILCNMVSLRSLGSFVERVFKTSDYLLIIVCSMIGTNLLPYFIYLANGSNAYSVYGGISGVCFGLIGSILVLRIRYKGIYQRVFESLLPSLILMLFISISVSSVSLSGHLGGMLGGMLATYLITKRIDEERKQMYYN